jgi:hypothetical protein
LKSRPEEKEDASMNVLKQAEKAQRFARLHEEGMLILPNAWDAGSAVVIASVAAGVGSRRAGRVAPSS